MSKLFWVGVLIGVIILWWGDAFPPPLSQYGNKSTSDPKPRLRILGVRIHHSTLGMIGLFGASIMFHLKIPGSDIALGISILFLVSQLPEIVHYKTLFWEDFA